MTALRTWLTGAGRLTFRRRQAVHKRGQWWRGAATAVPLMTGTLTARIPAFLVCGVAGLSAVLTISECTFQLILACTFHGKGSGRSTSTVPAFFRPDASVEVKRMESA